MAGKEGIRQEEKVLEKTRFLHSTCMYINKPTDLSSLHLLKTLISRDGTEKYVWKTYDGHSFETVLVKLEYRRTQNVICVSNQIGCPIGCRFCNSGLSFTRNLRDSEIIQQVTNIIEFKNDQWENGYGNGFEISFMSMGEPLLNWDNIKSSLIHFDRFVSKPTKVTISTVGIVPQIYELGLCSFSFPVDLQISLHSANQQVRNTLIPCYKYSLQDIIDAGEWYSREKGRKVCINYVLLDSINDSQKACQELLDLLNPDYFYVKLSLLNSKGGLYRSANEQSIKLFEYILKTSDFETKCFESRGTDINAGCGQITSRNKRVSENLTF